jgi:putative acetyltransferase
LIQDWISNKTPKNIATWVSNNYAYIAISKSHTVVGFIMKKGEILLNYILPGYIKMGIGKALLNKLTQIAKQSKIKKLTVNSTITAKPFYRKNGFIQLFDGKVKRQDLTVQCFYSSVKG